MDESEMNLEERFGDKDGRNNSDDETEREVRTMSEGYDMGLNERDDDISPPKLEFASQFRPRLSPLHTIDISTFSSVRYRPVPVMAQAELTSTDSHPRLKLPETGKVNNLIITSLLLKLIFLLIIPNIILAFLTAIMHCSDSFQSC